MVAQISRFAEILIKNRTISKEQFLEAQQVARDSDRRVGDVLVQLGYATGDEVMQAMAEEHRMAYVDLSKTKIGDTVIELVPEAVARENAIIPYLEDEGSLTILSSDPGDMDTVEKLRFILNRDVRVALAPRDRILEAINRYYGQIEGESADSMLQEFTDTQIDFTETTDSDFSGADSDDDSSAPIVRLVN
ncbi:MAG: hypothetical protein R3B96_21955 [Pirellulaceae bacterium]